LGPAGQQENPLPLHTLYHSPNADSAYQQKVNVSGDQMPELSLSKRFAGSRRIQLSSFEFSADQIEAVKRLIGRSIGEVECERIWPISVAAVLPPQSYSGFRSALCGTRSTDTLDVEKHCQIERPWSSARFGSQADKTADWVARTGVRMRLFCLIVLWLRVDRELSAGGLLILDRRVLSLNVSTTLIGR